MGNTKQKDVKFKLGMKLKNIHTGVEATISNIKTLKQGENDELPTLNVFTLEYDADGKSANWGAYELYPNWRPILSNGKK